MLINKEEELSKLKELYRIEIEISNKYSPNQKDNGSVYKSMLEERVRQLEKEKQQMGEKK